jgi:hypothetical protein
MSLVISTPYAAYTTVAMDETFVRGIMCNAGGHALLTAAETRLQHAGVLHCALVRMDGVTYCDCVHTVSNFYSTVRRMWMLLNRRRNTGYLVLANSEADLIRTLHAVSDRSPLCASLRLC